MDKLIDKQAKCKRGCIYYSTTTHTCDYWLLMDQRRPCPPGKDCTVYQRSAKGGAKNKWDKAKGKELWQQGKSDREIAEAVGATTGAVYWYRKAHWEKTP